MKDITCFSANVLAQFDNKYDNMLEFNSPMMDASNSVYEKYSKEDTQTILRKQFNKILFRGLRQLQALLTRKLRSYAFCKGGSINENVLFSMGNSCNRGRTL